MRTQVKRDAVRVRSEPVRSNSRLPDRRPVQPPEEYVAGRRVPLAYRVGEKQLRIRVDDKAWLFFAPTPVCSGRRGFLLALPANLK